MKVDVLRLNLGCGTLLLDNFTNVDHRVMEGAVIDDCFSLRLFKDKTVTEIVASHILEHACYDRTSQILQRWYQLLKDKGKLWVAVPNFELVYTQHLNNYLKGAISWEYFNSRLFGNAQVAKKMYGLKQLGEPTGIYNYELAFHRAVFTKEMLLKCMIACGFKSKIIEKIPYKKSHPHEICALGIKDHEKI